MKDIYLSLLHTACTDEEKNQIDASINFVENYAGNNFLLDACAHLYKLFDIDYIILGVVDKIAEATVHTVVFLMRGNLTQNTSYPLAGSPCENVVGKEFNYYPTGIQQLFPEDKLLQEMQVESYLGIPLFDKNEKGIGLLALLHNKLIQRAGFVEALMNVLLPRIEDELAIACSTPHNKQLFLGQVAAVAY